MTHKNSLSLAALSVALIAFGANVPAHAAGVDTDGDGIPDAAEILLGTDPLVADTDGDGLKDKADPKPLEMANPIAQGGKPGGIAIKSGIVENNVEPGTSKAADDHLELEVQNLTDADIKGVEFFLTLKDSVTGATENTYRKLAGFTIPKKGTSVLHFLPKGSLDFAAATDRFRANPNSALYKTPNEKMLNVEIAIPGFAPAKIDIKKDKGGAEVAD